LAIKVRAATTAPNLPVAGMPGMAMRHFATGEPARGGDLRRTPRL
jgi:hypothetical protein